MIDIERQLSGLKFSEGIKIALEYSNDKLPEQKCLIRGIMMLPEMSLKDELRRRNAAINAVVNYCKIEEGGAYRPKYYERHPKRSLDCGEVKTEEDTRILKAAEELKRARASVYEEKRPRICFICLGNERLPTNKRVKELYAPGGLTKHFQRKHLSNLQSNIEIECNVCGLFLEHKKHLQNHAVSIHGTVS